MRNHLDEPEPVISKTARLGVGGAEPKPSETVQYERREAYRKDLLEGLPAS